VSTEQQCGHMLTHFCVLFSTVKVSLSTLSSCGGLASEPTCTRFSRQNYSVSYSLIKASYSIAVLVSFRLPLRSHIAVLLALLATLCCACCCAAPLERCIMFSGLLHSRCPEGCAHLTRCVDLTSSQRLPSSKFQVPGRLPVCLLFRVRTELIQAD
jgi:hypothetical protein